MINYCNTCLHFYEADITMALMALHDYHKCVTALMQEHSWKCDTWHACYPLGSKEVERQKSRT